MSNSYHTMSLDHDQDGVGVAEAPERSAAVQTLRIHHHHLERERRARGSAGAGAGACSGAGVPGRTVTLSFMPSRQCSPTAQMNHLRPGLSRVTRSSPELQTEVAAALLHALKSGPLSSATLWELLLYLNAARVRTIRCLHQMHGAALNETIVLVSWTGVS
jgi:hypothetical protein